MAKNKPVTICRLIGKVYVPTDVTRSSLIDLLADKKTLFSVYLPEDDRFANDNTTIFFQEVPTAVSELQNRFIIKSEGIVAPIAVFGYDEIEDAVDHFLEIVNQCHRQKGK